MSDFLKRNARNLMAATALSGAAMAPTATAHAQEQNESHEFVMSLTEEGSADVNDVLDSAADEVPEVEVMEQMQQSADSLTQEAQRMLDLLISSSLISTAEAQEIQNAATNLDQGAVEAIIQRHAEEAEAHAHEAAEHGDHAAYNKFTLILSALALFWFAAMIITCMRGGQVSFLSHHIPFAVGLVAMGTQIPHAILHGAIESLIAFAAIMGISRVARGVTNTVDLKDLNEEEAKSILVSLGWLASYITTPAFSAVFSDLKTKLTTRDKYVAMHAASNVDGACYIGDFPFIYVMLQKGALAGAVWQAQIMAPIMLFHKVVQAIIFKVGPATLYKNREKIREVINGFGFDKKKLTEGHHLETANQALLKEFLAYIQREISTRREEFGAETVQAVDEFIATETAAIDQPTSEGNAKAAAELDRLEQVEAELAKAIQDKEFLNTTVTGAVDVLTRALQAGTITMEDFKDFENGKNLQKLIEKAPGLKSWLGQLDEKADMTFMKIMNAAKGSENEAEIGKVFTAQALAIGLLIPIISTILSATSEVPIVMEGLTSVTSSVADNYAAAAITWISNNAKAIAFSILAGSLTIYGNMANLNFLGKDADFSTSVRMAKWMVPTLMFGYAMVNYQNDPMMLGAFGAAGIAGTVLATRQKVNKVA